MVLAIFVVTLFVVVGCASPSQPNTQSPPTEIDESSPPSPSAPSGPEEARTTPRPTTDPPRNDHPIYTPPTLPREAVGPPANSSRCRVSPHPPPYGYQAETCCQGRLCNGNCGRINERGDIGCSCGRTTGGCQAGTVCCNLTGTCTRSEDCLYYPGGY